jgi:membrane protein
MEIERIAPAKLTDEGYDRRAEVGVRNNALSVDLARAREPSRGRQANTPEQIPPRGWRDILWRVYWSISKDRIPSTAGGVAFFALLAVFPGIAAIVSLYGLFADASTIGNHLSLLSGFLPDGVLQLIAETLIFRQ